MKELDRIGQASILFRPVDIENMVVVTYMDASYMKEIGMKSQSGFVAIATASKVETGVDHGTIVEFQSSTIRRVTHSTMASESAALALAIDRQLYTRVLTQSLLYGEPCSADDWRRKLDIMGILVSDVRSLYDHLHKTGSVPKERQTLLDLRSARELVEEGVCKVKCVSTLHIIADILTTDMAVPMTAEKFLTEGLLSLIPTEEEEAQNEVHRRELRQGERRREKDRKKALVAYMI